MRKHFLILMLLTLLPFAGWAQTSIADYLVTIGGTGGYVYDGNNKADVIKLIVRKSDAERPLTDPSSATSSTPADYDLKFYKADGTPTNVVKDAGNYSVSAVGKGNYKDETRKISFTVAKASIKYTLKENETDDASTAVDESSFNINFTATYKKENFGDQKITINNVKLVGTAVGGESVDDLFDVAADAKWSYTGTDAKFKANGDPINSSDNGYKVSVNGITKKTTANTNYEVSYEPNYVKIQRAVIKFPTSSSVDPTGFTVTSDYEASYTYNGEKRVPHYTIKYQYGATASVVETLKDTDFNIIYKKEGGVITEPKDADETNKYEAYAAVADGSNYEVSSTEAETKLGEFEIKKANLTISIRPDSKVYDGKALTAVDLDQYKIRYSGLANADIPAAAENFKNTSGTAEVTLAFASSATGLTNAGEYGLIVKPATTLTTAIKNYNVEWTDDSSNPAITGKFTIERRPVTVTLQNIEYERGHATLVAAKTDDKTIAVDAKANDTDTEFNVIIPKATEGSNEGVVETSTAGTYEDLASALTITLKKNTDGYEEAKTYDEVISLDFTFRTGVGANYIINGVQIPSTGTTVNVAKSNLIVGAEKLKVYVDMLRKEYGYPLNAADFECYAMNKDGDEVVLTGKPTYVVYDAKGIAVKDGTVLGVGSYVAKIDPASLTNLSAANYTITAANVFDNALVISKKKVTVKINPLTLNEGTKTSVLQQYASVENYKSQMVGSEDIAFEYYFNTSEGETGDKVVTDGANDAALNSGEGTYPKGIHAKLLTAADKKKNNDNYEVTFTYGALTIVAASDLVLNDKDVNLSAKIKAAAEACAATSSPATYNVKFSTRELTAGLWNVMVLPFDIKVADLSKEFGYAVVDILDITSTKDAHFVLHMGTIPANVPFMVKVAETINLAGTAATSTAAAVAAKKFDTQTIKYAANADENLTILEDGNSCVTDEGGNKLIGTYTTTQTNKTTDRILGKQAGDKDNGWWPYTGNIAPLRAILKINPANVGARILIDEEDGTTTEISTISAEGVAVPAQGWYTLNGVKLQSMPTEKGIYINNGKKVVIK